MKVHLIKEKKIQSFVMKHSDAVSSFDEWLTKIDQADWEIPDDIKKTFSSVDFLGGGSNRIVFNIGGNNYRLICTYRIGKRYIHLFVNWIGTHANYDTLCKNNKQEPLKNLGFCSRSRPEGDWNRSPDKCVGVRISMSR